LELLCYVDRVDEEYVGPRGVNHQIVLEIVTIEEGAPQLIQSDGVEDECQSRPIFERLGDPDKVHLDLARDDFVTLFGLHFDLACDLQGVRLWVVFPRQQARIE
jgi:hypothetical protein